MYTGRFRGAGHVLSVVEAVAVGLLRATLLLPCCRAWIENLPLPSLSAEARDACEKAAVGLFDSKPSCTTDVDLAPISAQTPLPLYFRSISNARAIATAISD